MIPKGSSVLLLLYGWIYANFMLTYKVSAIVLPCIENRTQPCVQNLDTFISLDKPRFAVGNELERLCREADDGQRCSSDFLKTSSSCVSSEDESRIRLQISRSQDVSKMLCNTGSYITDPDFRKIYLEQSSCIDGHEKKIQGCYSSSGIFGDLELEILKNSSETTQDRYKHYCCPMVKYVECSENAIGEACGTASKNVVAKVLLRSAGKKLDEFCREVDPTFPNSPQACVSSALRHILSFYSYFIIIFCLVLFY